MWGVDNTFLSRAVDADVFEPYEAAGLDQVPAELRALVPDGEATPVDFGDVCVNYDMAWFAEHDIDPPADLEAARRPGLRRPARGGEPGDVVAGPGVPDGDDRRVRRRRLAGLLDPSARQRRRGRRRVDRGVLRAVLGAGDDPPPLVVSYGTEPAVRGALRRPTARRRHHRRRRHDLLPAGRVRRRAAGHRAPDEAHQLVDFLLSPTFQRELPLNLFVFPANADVPLPQVFTDYATLPADPGHARPGHDRRRPGDVDRRVDRHRPALSSRSPGVDRGAARADGTRPEPAPAGVRGRTGRRARSCSCWCSTCGRSSRCWPAG